MRAGLSLILMLIPAAAVAQTVPTMVDGMIVVPADCAAFVTVQSAGCVVRNIMHCGPTDNRLMVTARSNDRGMIVGTDDLGLQIVGLEYPEYGWFEMLESAADRFDVRIMVETGADTFDVIARDNEGVATRTVGERRLTGQVVMIDNRPLQVTQGQYRREPDGMPTETIEEIALYDPTLGILLLERYFINGAAEPAVVSTPVDFIAAGETGFLSAVPLNGCPE